jgi:hypothetical protein|tara:strand:- start:106 stop:252 length:147 start_codon:yes stop_codon:yes gene_type:complete
MDTEQDSSKHFLAGKEVPEVRPAIPIGACCATATLLNDASIVGKSGIT